MSEYREVPVSRIQPSPVQMRSSMDPGALARLAESLRRDGQQRPVKVRPLPDEHFELVFGHRTVDAAKIAGMEVVQAIVEDLTDEEVMWAQFAENEYREDVSDYDRARWLRNMIDKFGHTQTELAERIGMGRSRIAQLLRMLELEKIVTAVTIQGINERQARAILAAPEEDRSALVQYIEVYLEERGETPPASAIEEYAQGLKLARGLDGVWDDAPEPPGTAEEYAEEAKAFIKEHGLETILEGEPTSSPYLTKLGMLSDEELVFCLARETRPFSVRRLNTEKQLRGIGAPLDEAQPEQGTEPEPAPVNLTGVINMVVGEPVPVIVKVLVEGHGLSEEEAGKAVDEYREAFPDIWSVCYPEKDEEPEEPEEPMTAEEYVQDVLTHSPEVGHGELAKAAAEMFGVSESYARGLIDRALSGRGRKPKDPYAALSPTTLCPLCGRQNAEKNRLLMVLEEYQATQPGLTLVNWLREVLA